LAEIVIFPVGNVDPSIADFLTFSLHEHLHVPCSVSPAKISLDGVYDIVRKQCYSTKLLERLLEHQIGRAHV